MPQSSVRSRYEPSLSAYLGSVHPKFSLHWTREKLKAIGYDWQCTAGDEKPSVMVLIDRGQILRPARDDNWSLDTTDGAEYYSPVWPLG